MVATTPKRDLRHYRVALVGLIGVLIVVIAAALGTAFALNARNDAKIVDQIAVTSSLADRIKGVSSKIDDRQRHYKDNRARLERIEAKLDLLLQARAKR